MHQRLERAVKYVMSIALMKTLFSELLFPVCEYRFACLYLLSSQRGYNRLTCSGLF